MNRSTVFVRKHYLRLGGELVGKKAKGDYALYKGDDILAIGTIDQIAKKLKVTFRTVRQYSAPSRKKYGSKRVLIKL